MQRHLLENTMSFESKKALLFLNNLGENSQLSLNNLILKTITLIVLASQKSTLYKYTGNVNLCVATSVLGYIEKTKNLIKLSETALLKLIENLIQMSCGDE